MGVTEKHKYAGIVKMAQLVFPLESDDFDILDYYTLDQVSHSNVLH